MKGSGTAAVRGSHKVNKHNRWGYIFLIPFFAVFVIFQLIPLVQTFYYSFFENYMSGLRQVGPNFIGWANYKKLISSGDLWVYTKNTMIMWILGFVPQIFFSLLLSAWFTDPSLRLRGQRFFKTVIYLPNLIMAAAFSMLFFTLFADKGPINSLLIQLGIFSKPYKFMSHVGSVRGLVAFMNFLMWFGNTTILLMAGMMGIDTNLFEAAEVDGATSTQIFWKITLPLLKPILVYVMIPDFLEDHASASEADSRLCYDHIADRRSADVRCPADPDQWLGQPEPERDDADHVPEQASLQQELRYGRRSVRPSVPDHGGAEYSGFPPDKCRCGREGRALIWLI